MLLKLYSHFHELTHLQHTYTNLPKPCIVNQLIKDERDWSTLILNTRSVRVPERDTPNSTGDSAL